MVEICPRCQQRFTRGNFTGDYVHDCYGDSTLSTEDVLVLGNYDKDNPGETGSVVVQPSFLMTAGRVNTLQGDEANIRTGARLDEFTDKGRKKGIYRSRQHQETIPAEAHDNGKGV